MLHVELRQGHGGRHWAALRALTGADEMVLDPADPGAGNVLLSRLLVAAPGPTVDPKCLSALTIADCDRLLAAVYQKEFGDEIDGIVACTGCGEKFEFNFALSSLIAHLSEGGAAGAAGPDAEGFYTTSDAIRFRPPTVRDLDEVAGLPAEEAVTVLVDRRLAEPADTEAYTRLQAAMERLAPILSLDIETTCPHCAAVQSLAFSLENYLLQALAQERRFLTHEIHRLAISYGWGLHEILGLSREDRRSFVRHIEYEAAQWASR
jgi:hypothetical protein